MYKHYIEDIVNIYIYMDMCFIYLILCSILWSISPIFYKKAGEYYKKKETISALKRLIIGFSIGISGTSLFILATNSCKTLTKSVTYTYALPILLTSLYSRLLFNEKLTTNKYIGLASIIGGLYLLG